MIDTIHFTSGFIVYIAFCIATYENYSKKDGVTNPLMITAFYFFYSMLAAYVINMIEYDEKYFVVMIEIIAFISVGAVISFFYYTLVIAKEDEKRGFDSESSFERL